MKLVVAESNLPLTLGVIVDVMTLIALLQQPSSQHADRPISFLIGYLILAFSAILFEKIFPTRTWHLPLFVDLVALGYFMIVSPSMVCPKIPTGMA